MGLEELIHSRVRQALDALAREGALDPGVLGNPKWSVEAPRKGATGDAATNVALVLAKQIGRSPRDLAELIAPRLAASGGVARVEIAGPGFLNVHASPTAFHQILGEILEAGRGYGRGPSATGERVLVEFVSANPTGPLLISHGRGAVVGDVIARLLEAVGHRVVREYYVNDFGNQVALLAESARASHRKQPPPDGGYGGAYVEELAAWIAKARPDLLERGGPDLERECVTLMLDGVPDAPDPGIRRTLSSLGVTFDVWSSEDALHRWGRVRKTLDRLRADGRLASDGDALMFVTGEDDDKDRVVQKSDGAYTYFAGDIAYHDDKISRGFDRLIDLWGADHHGYEARVRAVIEALGHDSSRFEVLFFQLVSLVRDGEVFKMGKRLGNLVTIHEVMEEIDTDVGHAGAGRDALRFYYLSRKLDTHIKIDVELAKKQGDENPVYYVQYGYARLCSILRRARDLGFTPPAYDATLAARLEHPLELALLALLGRFPAVVAHAAEAREPNRVVTYLDELARSFQSYYTQGRRGDTVLPRQSDIEDAGWRDTWDLEKTRARLSFIEAIRTVYCAGLELIGIAALEQMERRGREPRNEEN